MYLYVIRKVIGLVPGGGPLHEGWGVAQLHMCFPWVLVVSG